MTQRRSTACKTSIPAIHLGSVPFCFLPDYLKISACFKDIGRSLSQAGSKWKEKLGDFPQLFAQPCRSLQHRFEAGVFRCTTSRLSVFRACILPVASLPRV